MLLMDMCGTLADGCSHFDFYINSFLYAPVLVPLFSASLLYS